MITKKYYEIIIDNPEKVSKRIQAGIKKICEYRKKFGDVFYYNWMLHIEENCQRPFSPTHEAMSALNLHYDQP